MSVGAFKGFIPLFFSAFVLWADEVAVPAVTTNATTTVTNALPIVNGEAITATNSLPVVQGGTNAVPAIVGGTNRVNKTIDEIPATLGSFSVIPRRDPFRLNKPEQEEAKPDIVKPQTAGVPQLAGISTLGGNKRAVLRVSPIGGGKAEYVFISVGEEHPRSGVEVTKIDIENGVVEVLVREQTFSLELDKKTDPKSGNSLTEVRPSGSSYRPGFGSSEKKVVKSGEKPAQPSGSGLKPITIRNRNLPQPSLEYPAPFGASRFEPPQFDPQLQKHITDPASLSTQREIVRGQFSPESPTDIPRQER